MRYLFVTFLLASSLVAAPAPLNHLKKELCGEWNMTWSTLEYQITFYKNSKYITRQATSPYLYVGHWQLKGNTLFFKEAYVRPDEVDNVPPARWRHYKTDLIRTKEGFKGELLYLDETSPAIDFTIKRKK